AVSPPTIPATATTQRQSRAKSSPPLPVTIMSSRHPVLAPAWSRCITPSCLPTSRPRSRKHRNSPPALMSSCRSSWMCAAWTGWRRIGRTLPPITTAARACASLASKSSRAACSPRSRASRSPNSRAGLADPILQTALGLARTGFPQRRQEAIARLPEFEELREQGRSINDHALANLDFYLELYERNVTAAGGQVHWARTAAEA